MKYTPCFCLILLLQISCKDLSESSNSSDTSQTTEASPTKAAEIPAPVKFNSAAPAADSPNIEQGFNLSKSEEHVETDSTHSAENTGNGRKPYKKYFYPFDRNITDTNDRSIEAKIVAKKGNQIAFKKKGENSVFIIPASLLSPEDRDFVLSLEDGGGFIQAKEQVDRQKRLAGRTASWNNNVDAARAESAQLKIPFLTIVFIYGHEQNNFIQSVFFSDTFKAWADQNVSLCSLQVDDPKTKRTSSSSSVENIKDAAKLGITRFTTPSVLMVDGTKKFIYNIKNLDDTETAIDLIEDSLGSERGWTAITPIFR